MNIFSLAINVLVGVLFFVTFFHLSNFLLDYFRVRATKKFALENPTKLSFVKETEYACLPLNNQISKQAKIVHFKGKRLKSFMKTCYKYFFE